MKGPNLSLFQTVSRRWRTFLLAGSVTALLVALGYWMQPLRYEVSGLYAPKKTAQRTSDTDSDSGSLEQFNFIDQILNILFLRGDRLTPEANLIKDDDILQAVIQSLEIEDLGGNPASPRSLRRRIQLSSQAQGEVVKISLHDPDPAVAIGIVNRLMETYVEYFSGATPTESISFSRVIQPHLVSAETVTRQAQQAIYQIQLGSGQASPSTKAGDQTLELQAMSIGVQQDLSTIDADMTMLRQLLQTSTADQRNLIQQVIELGKIRKNVLVQLQNTLEQPRDAENMSTLLDTLERETLNLKKELTLTQNLYTLFSANQLSPSSITRAEQNAVRVVRPAARSSQGTRPFLLWFLGTGAFASVGVGLMAAYFRERLDTSLISLSDIYVRTQLPIFGFIPQFDGKDLSIQALAREERTEFPEFAQIMEPYSQTLGRLGFASLERLPQVLAFTSILPGEGKSLTVANLAYLLSKKGKKVLLLEADLFRPGQADLWNTPPMAGLCDCMAGDAQVGKTLKRLHPNLDLLQAGEPQKNKDVLLNSPGITILIKDFRSRYDHILVDTPALTDSVHGYLLANTADATLLVLRPSELDRGHLAFLRETLGRSGQRLWGLIINGATPIPKAQLAKLIQESQWDATIRLQKQKSVDGFEISTLSAISDPDDSLFLTDPENDSAIGLDPAERTRREKQEAYLYHLPLDELNKLVDVLWEDWSHDIELLLEQEEEVVQQSRLVSELQERVERGNPYLKLSSELQLKEEKEKLNLLAETYMGQRSALIEEKNDLKFYLEILFARTDAEYIPSDEVTQDSISSQRD